MGLDGMTAAGAPLLGAAGPVGAQLARRRQIVHHLAVERLLQALAHALLPQHARAGAVGYENPRHFFLHRSTSLPNAVAGGQRHGSRPCRAKSSSRIMCPFARGVQVRRILNALTLAWTERCV